MAKEKEVKWLVSSLKDIKKLPEDVQDDIGYVLHLVQNGETDSSIKALTGKDLKGVYEIRTDFDKNTYWAVYVLNLGDVIYMLHVFQKKSKKGIETPKADMDIVRARLKLAKKDAENVKQQKRNWRYNHHH